MNACLASTILLFISLVDLPLLEISEPRYRKCSVCLIEFPFKKRKVLVLFLVKEGKTKANNQKDSEDKIISTLHRFICPHKHKGIN